MSQFLYQAIQIVHYSTAAVLLFLLILAVLDIMRSKISRNKMLSSSIAALTLFQVVIGSFMAVSHGQESFISFCRMITTYLLVIGLVELLLLRQAHASEKIFPNGFVGGMFIGNVLVVLSAIIVVYI